MNRRAFLAATGATIATGATASTAGACWRRRGGISAEANRFFGSGLALTGSTGIKAYNGSNDPILVGVLWTYNHQQVHLSGWYRADPNSSILINNAAFFDPRRIYWMAVWNMTSRQYASGQNAEGYFPDSNGRRTYWNIQDTTLWIPNTAHTQYFTNGEIAYGLHVGDKWELYKSFVRDNYGLTTYQVPCLGINILNDSGSSWRAGGISYSAGYPIGLAAN